MTIWRKPLREPSEPRKNEWLDLMTSIWDCSCGWTGRSYANPLPPVYGQNWPYVGGGRKLRTRNREGHEEGGGQLAVWRARTDLPKAEGLIDGSPGTPWVGSPLGVSVPRKMFRSPEGTNEHMATRSYRPFRAGMACSVERVDPAEAGEAGEIGVATVEFGLVFHGKRGELGIGCQVAARTQMRKVVEKEGFKVGTRMNDAHGWLGQP